MPSREPCQCWRCPDSPEGESSLSLFVRSSAARPQCRSLPPGASPGLHSGRVPGISAAGRHIQPITVCERHAPLERQKARLTSCGRNAARHVLQSFPCCSRWRTENPK
ncbi:hypothetical protein NDU88_006429 [Pleurodeles waltl]|uniref:Uncharacterized protein n=1 Tax=Pleurodeles waltl TaxID=8319 RepID=A0AAV7TWU2_PLEWA|nr:hypothetical protein NDU88_006429 [Pleurodeles waltl]